MTELESIEKDYWWEIKSYLENPSKEALVDLLEQVYEGGVSEGAKIEAERFNSGYYG